MRAIVYEGVKHLKLTDVDRPKVDNHSVIVKVHACAICGTDVKAYNIGISSIKPPVILGHEFVGSIVEVGNAVQGFSLGDRVTLATTLPCGKCRMCRKSLFNLCLDKAPVGTFINGAFSEYLEIPSRGIEHGNLIQIPHELSDRAGCLCEPLGCVINGQNLAKVGFPDTVVIIGAGPIGILHAETARARGCIRTILIEYSRKRYELAKQFNIDHLICSEKDDPVKAVMDITGGTGADVVINAAPALQAVELAFNIVSKSGRISLFASVPKDNPMVPIDVNKIHYEQLEIYGASDLKPENGYAAVQLLASGKINSDLLITHTLKLEDFFRGIELINAKEALKVVVKP
jgi:L-iditol 2-dehydrogenase